MATPTPTTPPRGSGRFPAHPSPSPVMIGFGQVLAAVQDLIVAEVDLAGNPGHDPAVDHWFSEASHARTLVLDVIGAVLDLAAVEPGDAHLKRVLHVLRRVMVSDNADEIATLRFAMARMPERFFALRIDGVDGAVNRLVLRGLDSIEQYLMAEEVKTAAAVRAPVDADCELMPLF